MSDSTKQLGQLLDEGKMQVTFTGWKAELEATEKKLSELQSKYDELLKESLVIADFYQDTMGKMDKDSTGFWLDGGKRARDFLRKWDKA